MTLVDQIPSQMTAVQLVGHGGIEMLHYREDVPTPTPGRLTGESDEDHCYWSGRSCWSRGLQ